MRPREKQAKLRRERLYQQLRLQAEILCESHEAVILERMMRIILELTGKKRLNEESRKALKAHFEDCAFDAEPTVDFGGPGNRNSLYIDGQFDLEALSSRVVWTKDFHGTTIDQQPMRS